jgi:hypothetical protein
MCDVVPALRSERGSVTAEFAAVTPAIVLVLALCLGALQAVTHQLRLADVAADAARGLGRGDDVATTLARARTAIGGVSVSEEHEGEFVCARLHSPAPPGPFSVLGLTLTARSCALAGGL